jgi:hypothetical protein
MIRHDSSITSWRVEPRLGKRYDIDPFLPRPRFFEPDSRQWWRKGERPKIDAAKQRSYNAEHKFLDKVEQRRFANIADAALYVRGFLEKKWFQRRFPHFKVCVVTYKPQGGWSYGGPVKMTSLPSPEVREGEIQISRSGLGISSRYGGEVLVLHELAHAVLPPGHMHDARWRRTFVEFVGRAMGHPYQCLLLSEFKGDRLRCSPIKRIVIPQDRILKLAASRVRRKK